MHACLHMCMHMYIYIYADMCIHGCIYMWIYIYTYAHIETEYFEVYFSHSSQNDLLGKKTRSLHSPKVVFCCIQISRPLVSPFSLPMSHIIWLSWVPFWLSNIRNFISPGPLTWMFFPQITAWLAYSQTEGFNSIAVSSQLLQNEQILSSTPPMAHSPHCLSHSFEYFLHNNVITLHTVFIRFLYNVKLGKLSALPVIYPHLS